MCFCKVKVEFSYLKFISECVLRYPLCWLFKESTQSRVCMWFDFTPHNSCAHYNIVKVHWNESLHAIVPALCLWCYQDPTSEYYLWCVSSSQCATAVRLFLSTFNSNLAHYSQTTKALSVHSGAHGSEWWIFPITLLSIQVSGKHRPMETALEKPCSYVCLTPGVLGNVSTISTKTSKLKAKVKYPKSNTKSKHPGGCSGLHETYICHGVCLQTCECCLLLKLQTVLTDFVFSSWEKSVLPSGSFSVIDITVNRPVSMTCTLHAHTLSSFLFSLLLWWTNMLQMICFINKSAQNLWIRIAMQKPLLSIV